MTLSCSMGSITPLLFSRQLMVCFQGQTLFSDPINSPVATAIVALRACSSNQDTSRAKLSNPAAHPAAKTARVNRSALRTAPRMVRSEEHTSELQSRPHLVCRLLLEKKKIKQDHYTADPIRSPKTSFRVHLPHASQPSARANSHAAR